MCVTDTGEVYFTDFCNKSISCLSPSGSVSTVISTDPLEPAGISHSVDGGLLVTLRDEEPNPYKLEPHSRRLVRHITVTGVTTGHLMIMSPSGRMKSVYRGQNLTKKFGPTDVVNEALCNILVTDLLNKQIHLLRPEGEFLKFLLSENEVKSPYLLSLYMSTLWVGYDDGLVRVFRYRV
ncbi:uncharacterized protein LOC134237216 [Saccostrea cucullata]|uniref:uncharacterized protein LOC134237216 n=1 Tax=Saccostrea cuccullata TaxID=36930 RepID=UPI002ECFDF37